MLSKLDKLEGINAVAKLGCVVFGLFFIFGGSWVFPKTLNALLKYKEFESRYMRIDSIHFESGAGRKSRSNTYFAIGEIDGTIHSLQVNNTMDDTPYMGHIRKGNFIKVFRHPEIKKVYYNRKNESKMEIGHVLRPFIFFNSFVTFPFPICLAIYLITAKRIKLFKHEGEQVA